MQFENFLKRQIKQRIKKEKNARFTDIWGAIEFIPNTISRAI